MKKLSYYNFYTPVNKDIILIYNSLHGSYILIKKTVHNDLMAHQFDIDTFRFLHPDTYLQLCENSCIIDDSIDEVSLIQIMRLERRFNSREYELTINTSMNCNLGCWYCYENHVGNSNMSTKTADNILKHLKSHYAKYKFTVLRLGFFGGEPLLNPSIIKLLLSDVKQFTDENNVTLHLSITTNGTCLTDDILAFLKDFDVLFQITLDGYSDKHNTVRHYKNSGKGSYADIIQAFDRIGALLENYKLRVRVNFDEKTLESLPEILKDIDSLDRTKCYIGLHKVWQVDAQTINHAKVYEFIALANSLNFTVDYHPIRGAVSKVCYADNFHQAVFNYNGDVFKCTARDFTGNNREGTLTDNGNILWNIDKLSKRMGLTPPSVCRHCKLYPACIGVCSQRSIEADKESSCVLSKDIDIDDLILVNFNQYMTHKSNINSRI